MKRVLFGGSFNPPTIAHYQIIEYLATSKKFDEVLILPNGDSYQFKDKILNNFNHRVEMLKILCKKFDNVKILELENKETFTGTCDTLEFLNHPYFILGDDCLYSLHLWKNSKKLLAENHFIVVNRGIDKNYQEIILKNEFLAPYFDHFEFIDIDTADVSSSAFRNNHQEDVVTKEVLDYIKVNKLYGY